MKNFKKFYIAATIFVAAIMSAIVGGVLTPPTANAAAGVLTVTFDVYSKSDYDTLANYESIYGVDYETAKGYVELYEEIYNDAINDGETPADALDIAENYWSSGDIDYYNADVKSVTSKKKSEISGDFYGDGWWEDYYVPVGTYAGGTVKYYKLVSGSGSNAKYTTATTTLDPASGYTYADLKSSVLAYESVIPKTTFAAGDEIVILPHVQMNNLGNLTLYVDGQFPDKNDSTKSLFSDLSYVGRDELSGFDSGGISKSQKNFTYSGTTYTHKAIAINGIINGYADSSDSSVSEVTNTVAIQITIPSDASVGEYYVLVSTTDTVATESGTITEYRNVSYTPAVFSIEGESNKADLESVTIGSEKVEAKQDDPISANVDNTSSKNYDYWTVENNLAIGTTSVAVTPKTLENGTIEEIKYADKLNELYNGTTPTKNAAGAYTIPLTGKAASVRYLAIKIKSQDKTTTKWVVVGIPIAPYNQAYLDNYSVTVDAGASGATKCVLSPSTFSSSVTNYTIKVPADCSTVKFTPIFNSTTNYYMTAKMGTTSLTSGTAVTVSTSDSFSVVVTAQDGKTTKTYNYSFATLSNDVSLNVTSSGYSVGASGTTFTINNVEYAKSSINVVLTNTNNATISLDGTTVASGSSQTITLSTNGVNAATTNKTITVTSESGVSETYTLTINRVAANTNNEATFNVYTNSGTLINGTLSGTTWTANDDQDITVTGFYIKATPSPLANGLSTMKFEGSTLASGANSSVVSFTLQTRDEKTATLAVTSEAGVTKNYTINVARRKFSTDTSISFTIVDEDGNDISSLFVYDSTNKIWKNNSSTSAYLDPQIDYVNITVKPTDSSTKAKVGSTDYSNIAYKLNLSPTATITYQTASYQIVAEGATENVSFQVYSSGKSTDAIITSITSEATSGAMDSKTTSTSASVTTHTFEIDQDTNGTDYALTITKSNSRSKVYVSDDTNDFTGNPGSSTFKAVEFIDGSVFAIGKIQYLLVIAEDGVTRKTYTVDVKFTDKRDKNPDIASIKIYKIDYKNNKSEITTFAWDDTTSIQPKITLDYIYSSVEFVVTYVKSTTSAVAGTATGIQMLNEGLNQFNIQAQAENPDYKSTKYVITIERTAGKTGNTIDQLSLAGTIAADFNSGTSTYAYLNQRNRSTLQVVPTLADGASFVASYIDSTSTTVTTQVSPISISGLAVGTYKILTIQVESEKSRVDGLSAYNIYTIYIFNADDNYAVSNISILDTDEYGSDLVSSTGTTYTFDPATKTNAFTIAYGSNNPYIDVVTTSNYAVTSGDGSITISKSTAAATTKKATVKITSEFGKLVADTGITFANYVEADHTTTYIYNFTRNKAESDPSLVELSLAFDAANASKDVSYSETGTKIPANRQITIENLGSSGTVLISYKKKNATTIVTGLSDPDTSGVETGSSSETFSIATNGTYQYSLVAKAESGATYTYTITLAYSTATLSSDSAIKAMTLEGDAVTGDVLGYKPTTNPYNVTLRSTNSKARLFITPNNSTAKLMVDGTDHDPSTIFEKAISVGTTTIVVTCYAQDYDASDATKSTHKTEYTINITVPAADTDNTLSNLKHVYGSVNESIPGFASATETYTVHVTNDVTSYVLVPTTTSSNATISSSNATADSPLALQVGSNTATVVVKAEDGTTKTYNITVIRDDVTTISEITIKGSGGTPILDVDGNPVDVTIEAEKYVYDLGRVPYSVSKFNISESDIDLDGTGNTVKITGTDLVAGQTNEIKISIEASSGAKKEYVLKVYREAGREGNDIISYTTEDGVVLGAADLAYTTINYILPRNSSVFNPTFTVSDGATYTWLTDIDLVPGSKNVKTLEVVSEVGVKKTYTINVYTADTTVTIDDINLLTAKNGTALADINTSNTVDYDPLTNTYTITLAYSVSSAYIEVVLHNSFEKSYINDVATDNNLGKAFQLEVASNVSYRVYALSEYGVLSGDTTEGLGKSANYTIYITREAAKSDARLKTLTVSVAGNVVPFKNGAFDPDTLTYSIENIGDSISNVFIAATPMENSTQVTGIGNRQLDSVSGSNNYLYTFTVTGLAEDGSQKAYTIQISRGPLNLDDDNSIGYITLTDSNSAVYISETDTWNQAYTKNVTIPFGPKSISIYADKIAVSNSMIYFTLNGSIDKSSKTNTTYTSNIESLRGTTAVYTVYAVSENGSKGQVYTINITFETASSDNKLANLTIDGVTVPGFNPNTSAYNYGTVNYSTQGVTVGYTTSDSKAVVTGDIGYVALIEGQTKTLTVIVTAEDSTYKIYTITIRRDEADPYLVSLSVDGEDLLDSKGDAVLFDKNVKEYYVIVTYLTLKVNIRAKYSNSNYSLSCSNGSQTLNNGDGIVVWETVDLIVGENTFNIYVNSTTKQAQYIIHITRRDQASADVSITNIKINELTKDARSSQVGSDRFEFSDSTNVYAFDVVNKITDLTFDVTVGHTADIGNKDGGAHADILNGKNLEAGLNTVFVLITAEDGVTTRVVQFLVTRGAMEFNVKSDAVTGYNLQTVSADTYKYTLNLGNKKASALSEDDYKRFITWDTEKSNLDVKVVSDISNADCNEVVLSVSDGIDTELVVITLARKVKNPSVMDLSNSTNLFLWLILILAIILLIIIIISVNKDKYGNINKNRKKEQ